MIIWNKGCHNVIKMFCNNNGHDKHHSHEQDAKKEAMR